MSIYITNKARIATLAAAAVMIVAVASGASAHDFGGGNSGRGGFGGGGAHYDHIVVRDEPRGGHDRGGRDGGRGDDHGRMGGNTGVYCPSCAGPVRIGNRPSGKGGADGTSHDAPRPQTRPTTPVGGGVQPTASKGQELPPGTSSRLLDRSGAADGAEHAPRDIGNPHLKPKESDL